MRRALSHARVGSWLQVAWAGRLDAIASELAEHFERSNEPVRAIPHHQSAAAKALRRSANEEAIRHLRRALDLIGYVADEVERTKFEVELLVNLGAAFIATRGFGAPEVLEDYSRAETLVQTSGRSSRDLPGSVGAVVISVGTERSRHRLAILRTAVVSRPTVRRCRAQAASVPRLVGDLVRAGQAGRRLCTRGSGTCPLRWDGPSGDGFKLRQP